MLELLLGMVVLIAAVSIAGSIQRFALVDATPHVRHSTTSSFSFV